MIQQIVFVLQFEFLSYVGQLILIITFQIFATLQLPFNFSLTGFLLLHPSFWIPAKKPLGRRMSAASSAAALTRRDSGSSGPPSTKAVRTVHAQQLTRAKFWDGTCSAMIQRPTLL